MTTATVTSDLGYRPNFGESTACFAHYHLKVEEYGLWAHARQLAHDSGIFYFDGRKIAERFGETGKNTIYRIGKNLIRKGWLVVVRKPKRLKNGMFSPGQYRPVSHEEWAARHPGACLEIQAARDVTSPGMGTGEDHTSPGNGNDLSRNQERPVLESGHNIKGLNRKGECKENPESSTSRVQEPLTPITNSKAKAHADGRDDGIKPEHQTSIPIHQNQNQCVAAAPAYGTPEWLTARKATMTDEERTLAAIGLIELSNNRTFKSNGKLVQIVRAQLAAGVPCRAIVDAAQDIANTLDERDRMPGLTLEKNLVATIDKLAVLKVAEARNRLEEEKRIEDARLENERLERESAARQEVKREQVAAARERSDWQDAHGSHGDGFVSTNPTALYRADLQERIAQAYQAHSDNYSVLRAEAEKLTTEAVEARLSVAAAAND
jgi:hypothetical protein